MNVHSRARRCTALAAVISLPRGLRSALTAPLVSRRPCALLSRQYTVVLGADSLTANEATKQEFRAVRSIPHPDYTANENENDIMLLKVRTV